MKKNFQINQTSYFILIKIVLKKSAYLLFIIIFNYFSVTLLFSIATQYNLSPVCHMLIVKILNSHGADEFTLNSIIFPNDKS